MGIPLVLDLGLSGPADMSIGIDFASGPDATIEVLWAKKARVHRCRRGRRWVKRRWTIIGTSTSGFGSLNPPAPGAKSWWSP